MIFISILFILLTLLLFLRIYFKILQKFKNMKKDSLQLAKKIGELTALHIQANHSQAAKENFLATMSHEIRTPIHGIIGNSELFELTKIDEDQKKLLNMIQTSASNLMLLVDDILELPNLVLGKYTIQSKPFTMIEMIQNVIDVLTPMSLEKGLNLTSFIDPAISESILGDKKKIGQIFLNLANNALKFTAKGEVYLGVTLLGHFIESKEVELLFEVRDTGPGIPAEKLKRLFQAYVQTDASVSRLYGGTGLGLVISQQLAEKMGGKLWVESVVGQGSRFLFQAKFKTQETQKKIKDLAQSPDKIFEKLFLQNKHSILVVEDNQVNQKLILNLLKKLGYNTALAENGQIAVDMTEANNYSLILMDLQMPVMDGLSATKNILFNFKKNGRKQPIIVALTANAMQGDKEKCLGAGMDDYMAKPILLKQLDDTIKKWLR